MFCKNQIGHDARDCFLVSSQHCLSFYFLFSFACFGAVNLFRTHNRNMHMQTLCNEHKKKSFAKPMFCYGYGYCYWWCCIHNICLVHLKWKSMRDVMRFKACVPCVPNSHTYAVRFAFVRSLKIPFWSCCCHIFSGDRCKQLRSFCAA